MYVGKLAETLHFLDKQSNNGISKKNESNTIIRLHVSHRNPSKEGNAALIFPAVNPQLGLCFL
jgi:hypothetical protein